MRNQFREKRERKYIKCQHVDIGNNRCPKKATWLCILTGNDKKKLRFCDDHKKENDGNWDFTFPMDGMYINVPPEYEYVLTDKS